MGHHWWRLLTETCFFPYWGGTKCLQPPNTHTTSTIHHQLGHISTTHPLSTCSCCSLPCANPSADWAYMKRQRTSDNVSDSGFNNAAQEARKQISIHQSPHSAVRRRIHRARRRKYQLASPISRWRKRKTKQYFPCRFMGGVP